MSKMRKFMSLLLAAVMVLSVMTVNVFAEGEGTIKVENATLGRDYAVYKMFSMTKVGENGYAYIVEEAWEDFFDADDYEDLIDSKGQAVAEKFNTLKNTAGALAKLAQDAAAYAATTEGIDPVAELEDVTDTTLNFNGLNMGYYLVASNLSNGLCMLTNAEPNAEIVDKNFLPSIAKGVDEDDDDDSNGFVLNNDAYIGQDVDFQIVVTAEESPVGYVVTDTLEAGKWNTVDTDDIEVYYVPMNSTTKTELEKNTDYTVVVDDNEITVTFIESDAIKAVDGYDQLIIEYTATLAAGENGADVSDEDDKKANTNKAVLSFTRLSNGEADTRESNETNTYTWEIPVFKYTGNKEPLKGAKFVLQDAEGKYYRNDSGIVSWVDKIDDEGETKDATVLTSDDEGNLVFTGVDTGEYVLIETEAPAGYNMAADKTFTTTLEITEAGGVVYDDRDLEVENKTGSILPETGGIGTTIFRVGGAALIIIAGALLVAKKRTNNI